MIVRPLDFAFKGERNYVQGADIYYGIVNEIATLWDRALISDFRLSCHSFARNNCDLIIAEPGDSLPQTEDIVATISFKAGTRTVQAALRDNLQKITTRTLFDEKSIEEICVIKEKSIIILDKSKYLPMEVVISMTKQLHTALFPSKDKRWIFTKAEFAQPIEEADAQNLQISLLHNFNNALTKSAVLSEAKKIGNIYFSLVERSK